MVHSIRVAARRVGLAAWVAMSLGACGGNQSGSPSEDAGSADDASQADREEAARRRLRALDSVAPTVAVTSVGAISAAGRLTLSGQVSDNMRLYRVRWRHQSGASGSATLSGTHVGATWTAADLQVVLGDNEFVIEAEDAAGNLAATTRTVNWSGSAPPNNVVPPAIAAMQPGQWLELPNTKIRSVLPNPPQMGYAPYLIEAWNGATVDTTRHRLLVWGGGHGDYWGNEMYALDLPSLSMKRILDPSPHTSQANCTTALPDGTPTSRHTYFGLTYIAHADRFFSVNGSLAPCGNGDPATWQHDFTTGKWQLLMANSPMSSTHGTMAVYDAQTKLVYVKDQYDFWSYDPVTNKYTKLNSVQQYNDYHLTAAIDTRRRKFVMIGDGVQVIDLATKVMTRMSTTNTPALVTSQNAPGVAYDPVADRIVAWHGGSNVYTLNMDTGVWSQVATSAGPTFSPPGNGTYGRWAYVPGMRVFVIVNSIDQNAWAFRLTN